MKTKIIAQSILMLAGFLIVYLFTSFVVVDIDFRRWSEFSRFLTAMVGICLGVLFIAIRVIENEN